MRKKWKLLWIAVVCVFVINSYLEKDGTENGICVAYAEDMTSDNERIGAQDLSGTAASFQIDNEHLYDEMNETYSNGYVPKVENGYVTMVLPLLCDQRLKDGKLTASLDLGAAENSPFVLKNYEKQVRYTECTVNGGEEKVEAYPVIFSVELRGDRINGSYPVTINIRGNDISGMEVTGAFTIYVTISDGKTPVSEEKEEKKETISFGAKLMVEGCDFSSNEIQAGDEIQMNVRLHNTSTTENIKNADILITEPEENFSLISDSSNIFVGDISADTTITVSYIFKISEQTPQGQYNFVVAADYSDELGNSYSRSGVVKMNVNQSVRVEFGEFYFPEMVEMADTTKATVQIMNLGKESVSNVRAVISGDGLMPENAIYIGTVEAGQQAAGETYVAITSLKSSISSYGMTTGKITYYYEDKNGKTYEEEKEFQVMITSPFSENKVEKKEEPRQWWKIVMTVVGIIVGFGLFIFVRHIREKREENENS